MKGMKLLKSIVAFCICLALIRSINGAGSLSITDILVEIQKITFDKTKIETAISYFQDGSYKLGFTGWNDELTGIEGTLKNIGNVIVSGISIFIGITTTIFPALWSTIVETAKFVAQIFRVFFKVIGL